MAARTASTAVEAAPQPVPPLRTHQQSQQLNPFAGNPAAAAETPPAPPAAKTAAVPAGIDSGRYSCDDLYSEEEEEEGADPPPASRPVSDTAAAAASAGPGHCSHQRRHARRAPAAEPRRVTVYPGHHRLGGKVFRLPASLEELKAAVAEKLGEQVQHLFLLSGGEIDDIGLIRDNDELSILSKPSGDAPNPPPRRSRNSQNLSVARPASTADAPGRLPPAWVKLNVGGRVFVTTRDTMKNEPDSMLAKLCCGDWPSTVDDTGAILIDRSPRYFEILLDYLRMNTLHFEPGVSLDALLAEARFYNLAGVVEHLEPLIQRQAESNPPISRQEFIRLLLASPSNAILRCQGLNLQGCDLSSLDLRRVNFKMANMSHCDLRKSSLEHSDFYSANLEGAQLDGANLLGCTFTRATLRNASARQCNVYDRSQLTGVIFEMANLDGADFEDSDLSMVNLRVASLKGTSLRNCNLRQANLAGANLEECDLTGCDLHEANLRGANTKNTKFLQMQGALHMSQSVSLFSH